MTLVEVLVGLFITLVAALGFIGAMIYAQRANRTTRDYLYANQFMSSLQMMVQASNFDRLGESTTTGTQYEAQFLGTISAYGDPRNTRLTPLMRASFQFTGFGNVASATNTTLRASFPSGVSSWQPNEWAGHYVTISRGTGFGQVMRIVSNTADTLTVTADLSGATTQGWAIVPDSTSRFLIDASKTVHITVNYTDWTGRQRTLRRTVVVPQPAGVS
jgi:Tfp pilus assembly protein PilV